MQTRWLHRITYLYLLLPFILFCLGWLRLFIALPIAVFMVGVLWRLWNQLNGTVTTPARISVYSLLITGLWVILSGVGGYAFQNWDHHWRNAVFRDLINFDWPVYYAQPEHGQVKMLVYYVGYWLPAAWTGKLLGWKFANFILFLWTWLGVLLVALHLGLRLRTPALKAALLLIFFSGMDALGALIFRQDYPTLWPPIQHLEIWGGNLQYSSFTTQLFWVFNQAVPAWLCIALFFDDVTAGRRLSPTQQSPLERETSLDEPHPSNGRLLRRLAARNDVRFFAWALCFFFAPLASLGLLPYLLIEWFDGYRKVKKDADSRRQTQINPSEAAGSVSISALKELARTVRFDLLLASTLIVILSYVFFSSNTAAQERGLQALALKDVLVFFLLEGGILWLLLAPRLWRDPRWAMTGILLFLMPFIQFGSGRDFVMRASIAPLFYLMVWAGEAVFQNTISRFYRIAIIIVLVIGALTPLYEINRSVYRTFQYYFLLSAEQRVQPSTEPVTHLEQGVAPEAEHPGSLVADDIQTLKFMDDLLSKNFVANVRQSLYYRYIAPH